MVGGVTPKARMCTTGQSPLASLALSRCERQCQAVHAVAQAGGGRAVGEDVAEMAAAAAAVDFGPVHAEG